MHKSTSGALKLIAFIAGVSGVVGFITASNWGAVFSLSALMIAIQTIVAIMLLFGLAAVIESLEDITDEIAELRESVSEDHIRAILEDKNMNDHKYLQAKIETVLLEKEGDPKSRVQRSSAIRQ